MTFLPRKWANLDPLDIVWKNLFDDSSHFSTFQEKINYPVDIYETETGLRFQLAVVGVDKEDITVSVENNTLRVCYDKKDEEQSTTGYLHKGITRRSFDLAWRVASKFDVSKLEAKMDKGLLTIDIPIGEQQKNLTRITIQ